MTTKSIKVSQNIEYLIIHPFKIKGLGSFITNHNRSEKLKNLIKDLNYKISNYNWDTEDFSENSNIPHFLKTRKEIIIKGTKKESKNLLEHLKRNIFTKFSNKSVEIISIEESIYFYDWSIGTVEVKINVVLKDSDIFDALLELGEKIDDEFIEQNKIEIFDNWKHFESTLSDIFGDRTIKDNFSVRKPLYDLDLSGKLGAYGMNLILTSDEENGMILKDKDLQSIFHKFSAQNTQNEVFVNLPGLIATAEGYNGQLALLKSNYSDFEGIKNRVCWNWRLVVIYWSIIAALDDYISTTIRLGLEEIPDSHYKSIQQDLINLTKKRLQILLLLNEALPSNICADALDFRIYRGTWDAWQGEKLANSLKEQLEIVKGYNEEKFEHSLLRHQKKIDSILFVLNILTVATVIAALIEIYDINNNVLNPNIRIFTVFGITLVFYIILIVYLRKGVRRS